ncbi:MAG TPA: TonB-dependent receptor [Burkholderiaceae bacterium]|jgi:iron complex outermembrane receptor protein
MTTSITKRKAPLGLPRELASIKPVAFGCAVLMLAAGAQAQDAPQVNTLDTVVVTGIRKGIEDAISVKKNADGVVEAISAEDIGKLPDTTIAESLARLPGVTTQRTSKGEASTISIRGLGPDFNAYLLNGREQSSTGDSRAVDLSVYPAELIGSATVYKTSDATLAAAGLAGTLDTRLVDPLNFSKRTFAASYQKVRNSISTPVPGEGHRKSITYIDQFADRTVGVALGYVKVDNTQGSIGNDGWGGASATNVTLADGSSAGTVAMAPSMGAGFGYKTDRVADKRDGLAAILSYKPNKSFNSELDYYRAKIKTVDNKAQVQLGFGADYSTGTGLISAPFTNATVSNGVMTKGTFALGANPNGLIDRTESVFDDDKIESLGWRMNFQAAPTWKVSTDLSHNSAKRVERDIEAYGGIPAAGSLTFDTTQGDIPQFTVTNPASYTTPSIVTIRDQTGWSGTSAPQDGYDKGPTIVDKVTAGRVDFTHDLEEGGMFSNVQFGINYTKRTKDRTGVEGLIVPTTTNAGNTIPYPSNAYVINNVGGTGFNMLTFDPTADLWAGASLQPKFNDDILSKTWSVAEKVTTAYVKGNIDTAWGGIPVRGNVGLQIVRSQQSSSGFQANIGSGVTLTNPSLGQTDSGISYTDVLPSLNLTGDFGSGKLLRFGLSKQIARNNMTDMRNSLAVSFDTTNHIFTGSAGNSVLKPMKATALDLSFEKYFGNKAYLSAAAFFKKLDTYSAQQTTANYDFTSLAQLLHVSPETGYGYNGYFTRPVNGSGGNIKGFELTASAPFDLLTKYLSGFGASANYSVTSSSLQVPDLLGLNPNAPVPLGTMSLPGLSKRNAKAILYFEKWGFSAFVADNYRSTYVGSVANSAIGGYPTLTTIKGSSWVSAQVGYEIQSGYAKGLAIRFEGNNLNDPTYVQLNKDGSVNAQNKTGHQYILMLNYKYQ